MLFYYNIMDLHDNCTEKNKIVARKGSLANTIAIYIRKDQYKLFKGKYARIKIPFSRKYLRIEK